MSKKILITDDSLFIRKILSDLLSKKYEIVEADTGGKAIKQFTKEKPDLTLLDIIMPDGEEEGIRVLQEIMKIDSKAIVIMITAVGQEAIIQKCKKMGAANYIIKPFDEDQVMKMVNECLG